MPFLSFLRENARWLGGAFLMTLFSSFGQTFFISLSAGEIRSEYGLSHGQFGLLYMAGTLASALTLPRVGAIVDIWSVRKVTLVIVPTLAAACLLMALSHHILLLALTIYLLRLFGQGMMSQNAFTAVGRWFAGQRGKATSVTAIGVNAGEATFPFLFVLVSGMLGWRGAWIAGAIVLLVVALPLIAGLVAAERTPRSTDPALPAVNARDWTRGEVLRDPLFPLLLMGTMAPGFIGTTIFFHQVYLVELRGWSLEVFAASFTFMAAMVVTFSLISGQLIDRFSAVAMLPSFLVPLALACLVLAGVEAQWGSLVFMGLLGISYGFQNTLFGALFPEIYGVRNLGAIRAMIVAVMVFGTAAGPGLTGWLIDIGVSYPAQIAFMGVYCLAASLLMVFVSRRLRARALPAAEASATSAP
ncbi:MAG: MFS transporter [Rhizobiaceae bacterium]|nr:MFS transporter [Rhizobiaceae bacterium]MCV0408217.1 MFS transporter [Rhizobiaceae bacterium]